MEGEFDNSSEKKPFYLRDRTMDELLSIAEATSLISVLEEILSIAYDRDERKSEPLNEIEGLVYVAEQRLAILQSELNDRRTIEQQVRDEIRRKKELDQTFFDDKNPRREARINKIIHLFPDEK